MSSVSVPETFSRTQLRVIERLVHGDYPKLACIKSGLPGYHTERWITPEMLAEVERIKTQLTEQAREKCLADAGEVHEFLSDAFRARMSDIRNDDHTFKPRSEWPEIWDRLEESGEVEVTYESVRSEDGKEAGGLKGGWDKTGRTVEKVKLKFSSKVKLTELLMKHKAVDAMVQQKGDTHQHVHLHGDLDSAIAEGRQRAAARARLPLNVTPDTPTT